MVKTLLKDYNEIEEHKKSQLPQTLTTISEVKQNNINPEQNILEKSKNLVDGVVSGGGVKAEALHIFLRRGWEVKIEWNQIGVRLPKEVIEEIEWNAGHAGLNVAVSGLFTIFSISCGPYLYICALFQVFIGGSFYYLSWYNRHRCGSNGVWIYRRKFPNLLSRGPAFHYLRCW